MGAIKIEAQEKMILRALQDGRTITQADAYAWFACERLSARIFYLRKKGYNIVTTMVNGKNRYGANVRYAGYKLEE